jgi:hypothetical protein
MSDKSTDMATLQPRVCGSAARMAVIETLVTHPQGLTSAELAELTGLDHDDVRAAITGLNADSRIQAVRRGPNPPWRIPLSVQTHGKRSGMA